MRFSFGPVTKFAQVVSELVVGLNRLTFGENFQSFTWEGVISANTEEKIRNKLQKIPSYVIIESKGNALVTKGDSADSSNYVYLKNHDATNSSTVRVTYFL